MKAAIYAREFTTGKNVGEQLRQCAEFAEKNGFSVVSSYIESAPADGCVLPKLRRLTEDCAGGCFEAVIVADESCIPENETDSEKYRNFLNDSGIKIITACGRHAPTASGLTKAGTARIVFRRLTSKIRYKLSDSFFLPVYLGAAAILTAFIIHGMSVNSGNSDVVVLISPESSPVTDTSVTTKESVKTTTTVSKTSAVSKKYSETFAKITRTTMPPKTAAPKVTTVTSTVRTAPKTVTTSAVYVTTTVTTAEPPPVTEAPTETSAETTTAETTTAFVQQFPADINTISYEGLLQIPGIGEVTAAQIIALRERLGRINDMRRLLEIYGIGETRLAAFSEYLYVNGGNVTSETPVTVTSAVTSSAAQNSAISETGENISENTPDTDDGETVRINSADAEELVSKLGITEEQALEIINIRELIGGFTTVDEFRLVDSLTQSRVSEFADRIEFD